MRTRPTAGELRRNLIADSLERKRWLDQLLTLVREETKERVIRDLARSRDTDREP